MTAPEGFSTCISSNMHQPEQTPLIVTYCPVTEVSGTEIVPAVSDASTPPVTVREVRTACPEVPAGWQLCPGMPVFCGAQLPPTETLTSSGQLMPSIWSGGGIDRKSQRLN